MKRWILSPAAFTLAVEGLFLAGFFLLVVFGASTYRETVEGQAGNSCTRALLSYFSTRAKNSDALGGVELYREEGRPVLSFADPGSSYAVRVYQHQGHLVEDYGENRAPLAPSAATVIDETEAFQVEALGPGAFVVTTDEGKAVFCLKAGTIHAG